MLENWVPARKTVEIAANAAISHLAASRICFEEVANGFTAGGRDAPSLPPESARSAGAEAFAALKKPSQRIGGLLEGLDSAEHDRTSMPVGDVVRGLNRPLVQIDQVDRDRLLGAKGLDVVLELRRAQLLAHIATRLGRTDAGCSPMSTAWAPIRARHRETRSIRRPASRADSSVPRRRISPATRRLARSISSSSSTSRSAPSRSRFPKESSATRIISSA